VRKTNYKNAQSAVSAAKAGVRSAQALVAAAKTQVKTADAGVESATARLKQSNVKKEDTEIVAPFNGIISRLNIRKGDYWTPQRVNAGGNYEDIVERLPIIMIDPNRYEVETDLPAFQGATVKPGNRAFIILDGDRSQANPQLITGEQMMELASAKGQVLSVSPSVSPGERSVRVTIKITQGAENLQDGQQISAWIATAEKNQAKVAPFSAFVYRDQKPNVFVVNEDKGIVEQRTIQPGIEGLAKREILAGVETGEKLVTSGKNRLVDGTPVEIIP
jgi:RND family efflux transporter MFP subunit